MPAKKLARFILVPAMNMAPIIAVGCFAGLCPDESAPLEWEMIDFDRKHIDLPAAITKDGQRRIVDMSDNLIEWLFCASDRPARFRRTSVGSAGRCAAR